MTKQGLTPEEIATVMARRRMGLTGGVKTILRLQTLWKLREVLIEEQRKQARYMAAERAKAQLGAEKDDSEDDKAQHTEATHRSIKPRQGASGQDHNLNVDLDEDSDGDSDGDSDDDYAD
ncbi:hypothetical protein GGTG_05078 [Gaeumannomyces tritici R3-111a-1]|uniref:Uncharacterized protein n=1 Tax=Gaeumannomyces tritici (strain R3-111a-1) TaxID=644352 RepID=J3NUW9_GAET3|nr:hypothetical protein GGTG_05078 [Gaeumannomyces tritici R3-111a-1]EJT75141.1 hypothetical protein GGTG_05078 [Gaeumannomyces tritici R3-111a-1]